MSGEREEGHADGRRKGEDDPRRRKRVASGSAVGLHGLVSLLPPCIVDDVDLFLERVAGVL